MDMISSPLARRELASTNKMMAMMILVALMMTRGVVEGFVVVGARTRETCSSLGMVGNFLSGVTGIAPPSLLDASLKNRLVENTSLQNTDLECAYKATRDGWSAIDFHNAMDQRGSGLVVALSRSGALFGGFNPLGWRSTDDYASSNAAFLFFQQGNQIKRCNILPGGNAAIFDYATGGPCFGASDLQIGIPRAAVMGGFAGPDMEDVSINAASLREGKSSVGAAYNFVKGWPVAGRFKLSELEIYCNAKMKKDDVSGGGKKRWW